MTVPRRRVGDAGTVCLYMLTTRVERFPYDTYDNRHRIRAH
jgi:hypothetical protein